VTERRGVGREEKDNGRGFGSAYQGALEAVFSIVIGVGVGYAVDRWFGTEPWGIVVGITLGFGAFVLRLVRLGRDFQEKHPGSDGDDSRGEG
jgi:F0F1-type ATP synthase assembly protein I